MSIWPSSRSIDDHSGAHLRRPADEPAHDGKDDRSRRFVVAKQRGSAETRVQGGENNAALGVATRLRQAQCQLPDDEDLEQLGSLVSVWGHYG